MCLCLEQNVGILLLIPNDLFRGHYMATAKKTPVKKTPAAKKPSVKKATVSKKTSVKEVPKMRSFHVSPNNPTFGTFKITRQTVYWVIIVSFIIFMQLWILALQMETNEYIEAEITAIQENM
jgi:hypothetical protein